MASTRRVEAIVPPAQHPATTQANTEQDKAHDDPPDEEAARRADCDDCGLPEHPDLSCAHAAELIRARTLPGPAAHPRPMLHPDADD